jgi:hypothetical protein
MNRVTDIDWSKTMPDLFQIFAEMHVSPGTLYGTEFAKNSKSHFFLNGDIYNHFFNTISR